MFETKYQKEYTIIEKAKAKKGKKERKKEDRRD